MRLIDADALREKMYHEAFETDTDMQRWDGGCWIRYKLFEKTIERTPAADARENVHAHWINTDQYHVRCPNCKHEYHDSIIGVALFCPYCGAIMDGGDDE